MKMILTDVLDINKYLIGKFVVETNGKDSPLSPGNMDFWMEKRISFVTYGPNSKILLAGFNYLHGSYTEEEFLVRFNRKEDDDDPRYFRLLTSKELKILFEYINKYNY